MWIETIQLKMKYEMTLQEKEQDQDKTNNIQRLCIQNSSLLALHTEFFTPVCRCMDLRFTMLCFVFFISIL